MPRIPHGRDHRTKVESEEQLHPGCRVVSAHLSDCLENAKLSGCKVSLFRFLRCEVSKQDSNRGWPSVTVGTRQKHHLCLQTCSHWSTQTFRLNLLTAFNCCGTGGWRFAFLQLHGQLHLKLDSFFPEQEPVVLLPLAQVLS